MSIFDVFKKEAQCDKCFVLFTKTKLNALDSTLSDERNNGEVLWLCRSCLITELQSYFDAYKKRAVVVYPLEPKWNAYDFYTFERMIKLYEFDKKWVDDIRLFLPPPKSKCEDCGTSAHFNWCDPQVYYGEPFPDNVNVDGTFKQEILCGRCVGKRFAERIYANDLRFDSIQPPLDDDGFCTSWEM
jgi:hypothetical protein